MADNTTITPGTGLTVATDDVTGVHYQRIKLDAGGDGVAVPLVAGAQVAAASLPVVIASDDARIGILTETAPATDTASSGLNGRLQRIAQRLTSLIALLPGFGTAGTPSANVVSVQGVANGRAAPISLPTLVSVSATPTLDTAAYASGDCLHTTVIEFANAVAAAGGCGFVESMIVVDAAIQSQVLELWLFNDTVTPATVNTAHSISDADAAKCVGVVTSGVYYASALNSVSVAKGVNLSIKLTGTSLFGILVTRGTPTYAADSLTVTLLISPVG